MGGVRGLLKKTRYFPYITALLLALLYFVFQFHHIQRFLDYDQIVYANNILAALKPGRIPMFNPHHLHMEIGGKWFHQFIISFFKRSGFTDAVFNNRLRSLLAAAIGIFFATIYLKEITKNLCWGIIGGVCIGFCHGYLWYATKIDTAIFPAAGTILILWILLKIEKTKKRSLFLAIPAGIFLFSGVMFHQYMGIACIVSVFALVIPPWFFPDLQIGQSFTVKSIKKRCEIDRSAGKRYAAAGIMTFLSILLITGGYFYTGQTMYNLPFSKMEKRRWRGPFGNRVFQNWIMGYVVENKWGKGLKDFYPQHAVRGYTHAFLSTVPTQNISIKKRKYNYNIEAPLNKYNLIHNLLAWFTGATLFCSLILFPFLMKRYKRSFIFIFISLFLFSLFTIYWESYYYEFWLIPCLLLIILGILIFNYLGEKCFIFLRGFSQYPFYLLLIVFTVLIASHNIRNKAVPYSRNQVLDGVSQRWPLHYYMDLFSTYIYKYPDNPYQDIYKD